MKSKIVRIWAFAAVTAVAAGLASCTPSNDGPDIDDFFLNYDIPHITPSSDIPVGVFYYDLGDNGIEDYRYANLTGEYNSEENSPTDGPDLCPQVRPVLGRYNMNLNSPGTAQLFQQHLDWANDAGIDFFIMPSIGEDQNTYNHLSERAVDLISYMEGIHINNNKYMRWGNVRYCVSVPLNTFCDGVTSSNLIENVEVNAETGKSARVERIYDYFKGLAQRFFSGDTLYYYVGEKPLVVLLEPHRLHSTDSKQLYTNIRDTIYKYCGKEVYMVARQQSWSPSARYTNLFINGGVDAVYIDNMFDTTNFSYKDIGWAQCIDQNYQYNRQYIKQNHSIDFIPSISPSFVPWVYQGSEVSNDRYNYPQTYVDTELFTDMCNVAKMNLGDNRMVFIDAFNRWDYGQALEPSDPFYGNGYGMELLDIVRKEFKVR